jgi:N-acetyl sugar amidotransferase
MFESCSSCGNNGRSMAKPCGPQVCTFCVMDKSDPEIAFDGDGVCNHCRRAGDYLRSLLVGEERRNALLDIVRLIKSAGEGRRYDCVMGLSGGADSSFVALKAKELGLRPLAVHLDNGWDSELAVANIENLVKGLAIDLHTEVLDWNEFRDLQVAFLKASVPDAEIPTDHAIIAALYKIASHQGVRFVLSGANLATENILPDLWTHGALDWRYIREVHKRFGSRPLTSFPRLSLANKVFYRVVRRISPVPLLNYIDYHKAAAIEELERKVGWRRYDGKHQESVYTRFFQTFLLPRKFGIDKRRAHLSSLIASGQLTRAEALRELEQPPISQAQAEADRVYVAKKLGFDEAEFEKILSTPNKTYREYPTSDQFFRRMKPIIRVGQAGGILPKKWWL